MVTRKTKSTEVTGATSRKIKRTNRANIEVPTIENERFGNLLVCGQNDVGQLGLDPDNVLEKTKPGLVNTIPHIVDVKAGGMHSLCLTTEGEIWSFGCNDEGALGRDTSKEGSEAVPKKIDLPGKVVKISAGDSHSACLLDDGRVFAWGSFRDSHGSMGLTLEGSKMSPIEVLPKIISVDISSGNDHLVILTKTGTVYTIGCAEQGQLGRVSIRSSSGESRRGNQSMLQPGKITKRSGEFRASIIWATPFCTFLMESNSGQVYGFGLNNYHQLGLKSLQKGDNNTIFQPKLTTFDNVKYIAGGQHHTMVLKNDGKLYVIGRKEYGRLGLGEVKEDLEELTIVKSLEDKFISNISCGESSSFAITDNGEVYAWGMASSSQLGTGDEDDVLEPKLIQGAQLRDKKIITLNGGGQHTLFIVEVLDKNANITKPISKIVDDTKVTVPEVSSTINEDIPAEVPKVVGRGKKKATASKINGSDNNDIKKTDEQTTTTTTTTTTPTIDNEADKNSEKSGTDGKRGGNRKRK